MDKQQIKSRLSDIKEELTSLKAQLSEGERSVLADTDHIPAYVEVFETTIAKHYLPPEDFHDGSIRVVKPEKDILVYLGCLKSDDWDAEAERCSPNPTVLKTIVPNNRKYWDELEHLKLVHPEIKINYHEEEVGVEPVVSEEEQEELEAVEKALNKAEVI